MPISIITCLILAITALSVGVAYWLYRKCGDHLGQDEGRTLDCQCAACQWSECLGEPKPRHDEIVFDDSLHATTHERSFAGSYDFHGYYK